MHSCPLNHIDAVRGAFAHAADHPRLFLSNTNLEHVQANITTDPLLTAYRDRLLNEADGMLALEPVTRQMTGRRLLAISRTCLSRVLTLSFAYRLTGADRYRQRAEAEMLVVADFSDWNPAHFLDVGEMTAALAIGYDWLYSDLSDGARAMIRKAIVEKGLKTSYEQASGWVTTTNNWNPVCHGGLTMGALAVLEDEPELAARVIARAVENVPRAMHVYGPNGAYPEGPVYWCYGTSFNVLFIDALRSALNHDFGLCDVQPFMKSATYYMHAHGATGRYFNYSDCGSGAGLAPAVFWFARELEQPALAWLERRKLTQLLARDTDPNRGERLLPMLLIWATPSGDLAPPTDLHYHDWGETPVAMHRTGWDPNDLFVAIKGGSPSMNHGHMDIGSFVLDANGVRWALDLGAEDYHSLESAGINLWSMQQDSERWQVSRLNNLSHNTLAVDGQLQRVDGSATICAFSDDPKSPYTMIDMTSVYRGQLAVAKRRVEVADGHGVIVQDELQAPDRTVAVRWAMVTAAEIAIDGNQATLTQDGQRLCVQVLEPEDVTLEVLSATPATDYESPNTGMRILAFHVSLPPAQRGRLSVSLAACRT